MSPGGFDPILSPEQYLTRERGAPRKSEYCDGRVTAMAGVTRAHSLIAGNVFAAIRGRERPASRPNRTRPSGRGPRGRSRRRAQGAAKGVNVAHPVALRRHDVAPLAQLVPRLHQDEGSAAWHVVRGVRTRP